MDEHWLDRHRDRAAPDADDRYAFVDLEQLLGGGKAGRRTRLVVLEEQLEFAAAENTARVVDDLRRQLGRLAHVRPVGALRTGERQQDPDIDVALLRPRDVRPSHRKGARGRHAAEYAAAGDGFGV